MLLSDEIDTLSNFQKTRDYGLIQSCISEQKTKNEVRRKIPDALNFFPISKSRVLRNWVLKILELFHRDQRAINATVIETFEHLTRRQGELAEQNWYLNLELINLRRQLSSAHHSAEAPSALSQGIESSALDALFVQFDDAFRGTREDIMSRLEVYLPLLKEKMGKIEKARVLDLGCGRGEWLELLGKNEIAAFGVEMNRSLVTLCKARNLDVNFNDAISVLKAQPSCSLKVITAFHVIEHLPFPVLVELIDEILRVLEPGGFFIFETPNPKNYFVATHNFWLDPTHLKPIPSQFIKFLIEARGFKDAEVRELHPLPESLKLKGAEVPDLLNGLLYSPQDYAVIGYRP